MGPGVSPPAEPPEGTARMTPYRILLGLLCLLPALALLVTLKDTADPSVRATQEDVSLPGPLSLSGPQAPLERSSPKTRTKRYTITPSRLHWDHFNLTYKILSYPRNLINRSETRRGLVAAFRMWSDVSPFTFREVAPDLPSDLKIGVWLTNLVHIAAHEIGHALGLMHSLNPNALMHINATLTGKKTISQDEMWGIHRLYGCQDRLSLCPPWARRGFCDTRQKFMKKLCPHSCDFCYEFPFPTMAATPPPPRTKTKLVAEGRNVTFRCGQKIVHKKGKVYWYKDRELLEYSYPGYLDLNEGHMSIIVNAINEGTYTCIVKKRERILTTYSWRIRVNY
ncbi:matrix metalloproteinase-23 isoform X3 [Notamacropus eugenii]|uniref:matrix metalloproteinase-23 isoform X3 n=1 Tax=Notamacropus eugenii TaxID=9315 RepID=UPI003B66D428